MRVLQKTMGPLEEMQWSPDNNPPPHPQGFQLIPSATLLLSAQPSLFTGHQWAKPSVTAPGVLQFAEATFTFQEEPPGRKGGKVSDSL